LDVYAVIVTELGDAEVAHGSRLVQVGFMRRYDESYRALKDVMSPDASVPR
jgi:myo-inositol 2-dehydrogenase/D-chiro-inositol 1-dehydrogenase